MRVGWVWWADPEIFCVDQMPQDRVRVAMCAWLARHGINARHVVVPGFIARHCVSRRVRFLSFVMDEEGRALADPVTRELQQVERFVQLEAEPEPWPEEVLPRAGR